MIQFSRGFLRILSTEFAEFQSHQAGIIIVKHLINRRNNVTIVGVEPSNFHAFRVFVNTSLHPFGHAVAAEFLPATIFPEVVESLPEKSIFILFVWE